MKLTLTVEIDGKETTITSSSNEKRGSVENEIIQSIKMLSYILAGQYSKENNREQKDWIHTITKRIDDTNVLELSKEDTETVKRIFDGCISPLFYYSTPEQKLEGEIGLLNCRLISK